MIDLIFKNGQAPALNDDNINKIVNGINQNEAKAKDLQSEIATLVIEKGGSIVQANPEEIPPEAEELNRLRINDKVYNISTAILNERITELDGKIDTDVSQLQDSIASKVTQLTFETGIDIGDWEAVIDPDEPVIYERYMNYHDAVAKLSQQIDVMGNRTDDLKTSLNDITTPKVFNISNSSKLVIYGNVVSIIIIDRIVASPEGTLIGNVPIGYRPAIAPVLQGAFNNTTAFLQLNKDGNFYAVGSGEFRGVLTYIAY